MNDEHRAPPWRKLVWEAPALVRLVLNQARGPVVREPCSDGLPVLVLPGLLTNDTSTLLLRRTLAACGFHPYGWGLGINMGARADLLDRLGARLIGIASKEQRSVALLGWSLGGVYARELARRHSEKVRFLVTLAAPFSGDVRANNAWRLYELLNDHKVDSPPLQIALGAKPAVRTVAVWSSSDGVVAPACARGTLDEVDEQVELRFTHMGLGSQPAAIREIVQLLCRLSAADE